MLNKTNSFIFSAGISLGSILLLALISNLYGIAAMGLFSLYLTVVAFIGFITDFGLNISAARLWRKYESNQLLINSIIMFRGFICIMTCIGFTFIFFFYYSEYGLKAYTAIMVAIIGSSLGTVWINQCLGNFHKVLLIDSGVKLISYIILFSMSLFQFEIIDFMLVYSLFILTTAIVTIVYNKRYLYTSGFDLFFTMKKIKEIIRQSSSIFLSRITNRTNDFLLPFLISTLFGLNALGLFAVIDKILKPVFNLQQPIISMFTNRIYAHDYDKKIISIFITLNVALIVIIFLGMLFAGEKIYELFGINLNDGSLINIFAIYSVSYLGTLVVNNFILLPNKLEKITSTFMGLKFLILLIIFLFKIDISFKDLFIAIIILDFLLIPISLLFLMKETSA